MSDTAELQKAIRRLKTMNADLEESVAFFKSPVAPFPTKNGSNARVVMLAKWADIIVSNNRIIAAYEDEIAKRT